VPDTPAPQPSDSDPYPFLLGGDRSAREETIRQELRYLSLAYRSREISVVPRYFVSPMGTTRLTYAQARVFNPTAFDTFTQDWRVALEPATMIEDGGVLMGLGDSGLMGNVGGQFASSLFGSALSFFGDLSGDALAVFNAH
jgi:hypothetical protein